MTEYYAKSMLKTFKAQGDLVINPEGIFNQV